MNQKKEVYRNILTFFVNNKDQYTWYIKPIEYILEHHVKAKHWNDFLIIADDEYETFYIIHEDRKLNIDYSDAIAEFLQTKLKQWISSFGDTNERLCGICLEEKNRLLDCAKCTGSYCSVCFHKMRQGIIFKCAFCRTIFELTEDAIFL